MDGLSPSRPGKGADKEILIDFRIRAAAPARPVFSWGGRYGLRLGSSDQGWQIASNFDGAFLISQSRRAIEVSCAELPPRPEVVDILARRVLPRVATLFGSVAIHCAAISDGTTAILLLGRSGAGKSTLSAAMSMAPGWSVLSEDISVVSCDTVPQVELGPAGICLWSESVAGLGLDPDRCAAMPGYVGKLRYQPNRPEVLESVPLRAVFFIERTDLEAEPLVVPVGDAEVLMGAIRQLVLFNPASHRHRSQQVTRLNSILRKVPAYRLRYSSGHSRIREVQHLLTSYPS